jgi:hypothetical protein
MATEGNQDSYLDDGGGEGALGELLATISILVHALRLLSPFAIRTRMWFASVVCDRLWCAAMAAHPPQAVRASRRWNKPLPSLDLLTSHHW